MKYSAKYIWLGKGCWVGGGGGVTFSFTSDLEVLMGNWVDSSAYVYNEFIYQNDRVNTGNGSAFYGCIRQNCRGLVRKVMGKTVVCGQHDHDKERVKAERLKLKIGLREEERTERWGGFLMTFVRSKYKHF